jgi:hypothetical protein
MSQVPSGELSSTTRNIGRRRIGHDLTDHGPNVLALVVARREHQNI